MDNKEEIVRRVANSKFPVEGGGGGGGGGGAGCWCGMYWNYKAGSFFLSPVRYAVARSHRRQQCWKKISLPNFKLRPEALLLAFLPSLRLRSTKTICGYL